MHVLRSIGFLFLVGIASGNALRPARESPILHLEPIDSIDHSETYQDGAYMPIMGDLAHNMLGFQTLRISGTNPSLVVLPEGLAERLHYPEAYFVASSKSNWIQCRFLGTGETANRECHEFLPSKIALLDKNLQVLTETHVNEQGDDLVLVGGANGSILASFHTLEGWHLRQLKFAMKDSSLKHAYFSDFELSSAPPRIDLEGQNIGILIRGGSVYALNWVHSDHVDVLTFDPATTPRPSKKKSLKQEPIRDCLQPDEYQRQLYGGEKKGKIHNNGHPVFLSEIDAYLGVAHTHTSWGKHGATFGSEYAHYFYLLDAQPPFKMTGFSSGFCFPAVNPAHKGACEVIQYIGSLTRDPNNSSTLLVSYGINDCEAVVARVQLDAVLGTMSK